MTLRQLMTATALAALAAASVGHAQTPASMTADQTSGRRIAERHCGGCHAIDGRRSPLPAAPPFADIHRRYPAGGLDQILTEGMIAPTSRPEEGPVLLHPSMPMALLAEDEIADLRAYLKSLEPRAPAGAGVR